MFRPSDVEISTRANTWAVQYPDGSPVPDVAVIIIDVDGFNTMSADAQGRFQSDDMRPGKYVVGINAPGSPKWQIGGCGGATCEAPPASLYYPGVRIRSDGLEITSTEDQKRDDVDFIIPRQ